jgi:alkylmercury lyase-like protein
MTFDDTVKMSLYSAIVETTRVPTSAQAAQALEADVREVEEAFARLAGRRLLVLEPGSKSRVRMAPPFSGVETPFLVRVSGKAYFANCVWDSLGVPAALGKDARIEASDGETGEKLELEVRGGKPVPSACIAHFAIPAARWWDDIITT